MKKKNNNETGGVPVKIAAIALTGLIVVVSAAVVLWYDRTVTHPFAAEIAEFNKRAEPFMMEYDAVVEHLRLAKEERIDTGLLGRRKTTLIFDQCYENLYETVYAMCKKKKIAGTFTLSGECMAGDPGCITVGQYKEMTDAGWTAAIRIPEGLEDLDAYLADLEARLSALGVDMPDAVYFSRTSFDKALYGAVAQRFRTLYYFLDDDLQGVEFPPVTGSDSLVAVPYLYTSRKTAIRDRYLSILEDGKDCSICTAQAVPNDRFVDIDRQGKDTTVINLDDIIETVTARTGYYRSTASYRKEELLIYTTYAELVAACEKKVGELDGRRRELYDEILAVYS